MKKFNLFKSLGRALNPNDLQEAKTDAVISTMLKKRKEVKECICNGCGEVRNGCTLHPYLYPFGEMKDIRGGWFCPECLEDFDVRRLIIAATNSIKGRVAV
jgi:hypothetical protein